MQFRAVTIPASDSATACHWFALPKKGSTARGNFRRKNIPGESVPAIESISRREMKFKRLVATKMICFVTKLSLMEADERCREIQVSRQIITVDTFPANLEVRINFSALLLANYGELITKWFKLRDVISTLLNGR